MRLLDLCCGAGGASKGYAWAGLDVVGVDIEPQPNYPFEFHQADALTFPLDGFDAYHASVPCQAFSPLQRRTGKTYPDLVAPVRDRLRATGRPYVMENVVGAPLAADSVLLCGSMFGLAVERHRLFECSFPVERPSCDHAAQWRYGGFPPARSDRTARSRVVGVYGSGGGAAKDIDLWRWAMGIDWMQTKHEIAESIPPAYTRFVGAQLIDHLTLEEAT